MKRGLFVILALAAILQVAFSAVDSGKHAIEQHNQRLEKAIDAAQ